MHEPYASKESRYRQDISAMSRRWKILMNLEIEYKATMVGLHKYMTGKNDPQIQAMLRHHNSKVLHSVPKEAAKYLNEAGTIQDLTIDIKRTAT